MPVESKTKKRYVLCKQDGDSNVPRPCAFFNTEVGCRSGSSCPFLHEGANAPPTNDKKRKEVQVESNEAVAQDNDKKKKHKKSRAESPPPAAPVAVQETATQAKHVKVETVVASVPTPAPAADHSEKKKHKKRSSRGEGRPVQQQQLQQQQQTAAVNVPVNGSSALSGLHLPISPFSPPGFSALTKVNPVDAHTPGTIARKVEEEEDSSFLFSVVNTALAQGQIPSPQISRQSVTVHAPQQQPQPAGLDMFVARDAVGQVLETSGTEHATRGPVAKKKAAPAPTPNVPPSLDIFQGVVPIAPGLSQPPALTPSPVPVQGQAPPQVQVPVDSRAADWAPLVASTMSSPRFVKDYTFPADHEWVSPRPYGEWCMNAPPVLAMDCEMCESMDPVTGAKNPLTLIRFSVVNGLNPSEVIIDSLVAPSLPISEMRTNIHGISEESLQAVRFSLRHAQAAMMNICSDRTILVGHALHHDLRALKFNHQCVVDTAYLYRIEDEPHASPGLRDIAATVLNRKLSTLHDSVQDAQVALSLAAMVKTHGTPRPVPRTPSGDPCMLLIHRIPTTCTEEAIKQMFLSLTHVVPVTIQPVQHPQSSSSPAGKTNAIFVSSSHANLAFDTLPGPDRPDKANRSQKRVYLKGGGYICVRKC